MNLGPFAPPRVASREMKEAPLPLSDAIEMWIPLLVVAPEYQSWTWPVIGIETYVPCSYVDTVPESQITMTPGGPVHVHDWVEGLLFHVTVDSDQDDVTLNNV